MYCNMFENMEHENNTKNKLGSVENVFNIINYIQQQDGAGVTEIAEEFGYAKSTIHSYLSTMNECGYVVNEGEQYCLSLEFLAHGIHRRERILAWETVGPILQQLADETSEAVWFTIEEDGRVRNLYKCSGERAISLDTTVGRSMPIHALAAGKAILSMMSQNRVEQIIAEHGLTELTSNTITAKDKLFSELDQIRKRGFAIDNEEHRMGLRSIAVPLEIDSETYGAIVVSGPAHRIKNERLHEEIPDLVLGSVNELELRLKLE